MLPPPLLAEVRRICTALPDVEEEAAWVGTRWVVRGRNFAHLVPIEGGWPPAYARAAGTQGPCVVLTFRAAPELADLVRSGGTPMFVAAWGTKWGPQVLGQIVHAGTDWQAVAARVTDSYHLVAAKPQRARLARARPHLGGRRAR